MTNEKRPNMAHVARVRGQLSNVANRLGAELREDVDDLDVLDYADISVGNGFGVRLFKYRGVDEQVIDIMFASQQRDWRERLSNVLRLVDLGAEDVLWINEGYLDTP